jgi:hypothetical protein
MATAEVGVLGRTDENVRHVYRFLNQFVSPTIQQLVFLTANLSPFVTNRPRVNHVGRSLNDLGS